MTTELARLHTTASRPEDIRAAGDSNPAASQSSPQAAFAIVPSSRPAQPWITIVDGQRLRQIRRQRGLSQEKLANQAGISLSTIARLAAAVDEHPAAIVSPDQRWPAACP
jgi:ribosome-binding protein aMBF1 (putative translation factor)